MTRPLLRLRLLPAGGPFTQARLSLGTRTLSERWIPRPEHLSPDVQAPWRTMDRGGEEEEPAAKAAGPRTEPEG